MLTTLTFRHSLKTRIMLATLSVFLVSLWSLTFYATRTLYRDIEHLVGQQQLATAGIIAEQINRELTERLQTLQDLAATLSDKELRHSRRTQDFLNQRHDLLTLFNNQVFVIRNNGDATAWLPFYDDRSGLNFADRDYLVGAIQDGKATIGRPVMSRVAKAPVVVMAVPIRDGHGGVIGALAGSISLEKPTFLDQISHHRYGRTGVLQLVSRKHRQIVTATDLEQIMNPLPPEGLNPVTDRFMAGAEGSATYVDSRGSLQLVSARQIPIADWMVMTSLPTQEAFAPIHALQQRLLIATFILTAIAAVLTWWLLHRQLAPLQTTVRTLDKLSRAAQTPPPLPVDRNDEIGQLIAGFNRLLLTLRQREQTLKESELHFRMLTEGVSDVIWELDRNLRITYINPADEKMRGFPAEHVLGRPFHELSPAEERQRITHALNSLTINAGTPPTENITFVVQQTSRKGPLLWAEIHAGVERAPDGSIAGYRGISRNISERRHMEEQIRQLAFHDTLTGLPNRRLLTDRLQQAIAASRRNHVYGALLFIDLDNFKLLNDLHGHNAGDLLLIEVASRLKSCLREMDSVARFGGDEFVVLIGQLETLRAASQAQAEHIADKIRAMLAAPYILSITEGNQAPGQIEHHCSASIGITLFNEQRDNPDDLLKWADRAMYSAKQGGRNRLAFSAQ